MTEAAAPAGPLRRAMATITELRAELERLRRGDEVAVVGMALRAPGGIDSPAALWQAVAAARTVTGAVPPDRAEAMNDRWAFESIPSAGGYLDDPWAFDASFFRISPREARAMDPQHRLLLELTWEAFEHAGRPIGEHAGETGVFVGITAQDHRWRATDDPGAHWTSGNGNSFAAGRLAYTFDFRGPALAVDTACSSSLTALHLARTALLAGECEIAVAAGVNLILSGRSSLEIERTGALSPNGSCRPFDARANGFVRGEGCAVLVVRRLSDAVAAGDRVLAVIRGSGLNQDGASSGFSAPNVRSQELLLARVLHAAQVAPEQVGFVQTHGTGTPLGDPIELAALAEIIGRPEPTAPHLLGSVKGNLGHTEAAAGMFGVVTAVEAIRRRIIPPQAGFESLNPRIELDGTGLQIPTAPRAWDDSIGACALVSSFGMSGTNGCVVLSPAREPAADGHPAAAVTAEPPVAGLLVSAATAPAARALAGRYRDALMTMSEQDYPDFARTVTAGRTRLAVAHWVAGSTRAEALAGLAAVAEGTAGEPLATDAPLPAGAELRPRRVVDAPSYPWQHARHLTAPRPEPSPALAPS